MHLRSALVTTALIALACGGTLTDTAPAPTDEPFFVLESGEPATVAVLPLEQSAGGTEWSGLGTALSGMVVADLSEAPNLTLVERDRLDAVLEEIALGESAFVDPATAAELGRGLGADLLVMGSYAVVADVFTMEARIVEVQSGRVVTAGKERGTVEGFDLVESLVVAGLVERMALPLSAEGALRMEENTPTDDLVALSAWGEGQDAEAAGELDAAEEAYGRAVASDPAFEEASASLLAIRKMVEEAKAEQLAREESEQAALFRRTLDAWPDERTRPDGFVHDDASRFGFGMRHRVLMEQDRWCQLMDEMRAFLDHHDWRIPAPSTHLGEDDIPPEVAALGWTYWEWPKVLSAYAGAPGDPRPGEGDTTAIFILEPYEGLSGAIIECLPPLEGIEALDALRADVVAHEVDGVYWRRSNRFYTSAEEGLMLGAAWHHAWKIGADEGLERRFAEVLQAIPEDDPRRGDVLKVLDGYTARAR